MVSPGRKWVLNHGKIWKKMSELSVQSYLSLVTETGSRFVGSKSELISGASSSAVKFCRMISSVFYFFCNSFFSGQQQPVQIQDFLSASGFCQSLGFW